MKRVLVLGRGSKAGAWAIRGIQLGSAIGATVVNGGLNNMNLIGFDIVVLVKRPLSPDVIRVHAAGIPIVWDIVDSWPQPLGNQWSREAAMSWLRGELRTIKPAAVIVQTKSMAADCAETNWRKDPLPSLLLHHHARPNQRLNPIRETVSTIGYEGNVRYLGQWRSALENCCAAHGWNFRENPVSLSELDIVVALRDNNGYPARHWKSNVKLANAQATGTPCVLNREEAYLETASGGEFWADDKFALKEGLAQLCAQAERQRRAVAMLNVSPRLDRVAHDYRQWLEKL